MRTPVIATAAVTLGLLASTGCANANADQPDKPDTDLLQDRLDDFAGLSEHAVLAEVRNGDRTWSEATGPRNLDPGSDQARPGDLVRIGSATKSFTASVLIQLEGEGELDLDDPIGDHLPGLLPYDEDPTVRQLMTHTSGLPDFLPRLYPSLAEGDISDIREGYRNDHEPEELVALAAQDPPLFEPGEGYAYSNAGYAVLGLLIEDLTGNTLGHELEDRVIEPAGLDDTYLLSPNGAIRGPHPVPYITTGESDDPYFDTTGLSGTQLWAGGGIVSTTGDMNDFYGALTDGTLLTERQLAEATDWVDTGKSLRYGLGLFGEQFGCADDPEEVFIGHTGDALGHEVSSFHSVDGERQVTVAWNIGDKHGYTDPDEFDRALDAFIEAGLCDADA